LGLLTRPENWTNSSLRTGTPAEGPPIKAPSELDRVLTIRASFRIFRAGRAAARLWPTGVPLPPVARLVPVTAAVTNV
jgi:hypothetical protein